MEDQAFLPSYDLAPPLPPPPHLPSKKSDNLLTGEGGGLGEEPDHTSPKKPGPLKFIQYSLHGRVDILALMKAMSWPRN
jgi:hypothetical protein